MVKTKEVIIKGQPMKFTWDELRDIEEQAENKCKEFLKEYLAEKLNKFKNSETLMDFFKD